MDKELRDGTGRHACQRSVRTARENYGYACAEHDAGTVSACQDR